MSNINKQENFGEFAIIILAGIAIYLSLGNNGIFIRAKQAKETTNKQTATEIINLKITNCQMNKYAEEQRMPTLKELSIALKEDNEISYVTETSKVAVTEYEVSSENPSSIYTKLNKYPYEFEINSRLQLASINGVKVANAISNGEISINTETLNSMFYPNKRIDLTLSSNKVTIPRNGWLYIRFNKVPDQNTFSAFRNEMEIMYIACPTAYTGDSAYIPVKKDDVIRVTDQNYFKLYLDYYENVQ